LYKSVESIFFLHFIQYIDIVFVILSNEIGGFYKGQRSADLDKKRSPVDNLFYV